MSDYKKLIVNEKCVGCGSCLGLGYEFLGSSQDGNIVVKENTVLSENSQEYLNLKKVCPVDVFELEAFGDVRQQFITEFEKLKYYTAKHPKKESLKFQKEEYCIPIPSAVGEYKYEYSSESSAKNAARTEFDRKMYSKIDTLILKIITEYRVKYLQKYYIKEDDGFFSICNKEISEILNNLVNILKLVNPSIEFPAGFSDVKVYPDKDFVWKMLNKGELMSDEMIQVVKSEFYSNSYSSLSSYESYWDIEEREVADGTDWRGNTKYKDKFCYCNMREAFKELAKDILNSCYYVDNRIEDRAIELISGMIDVYNEQLQVELASKIEFFEKQMETLPAISDSTEVHLNSYDNIARWIFSDKENDEYNVNDEVIKEKEVFVTASGDSQFFYDGVVIKKRFIRDGDICNEVIMKNKNLDIRSVCSFDGYILCYDEKYTLFFYNCHNDELKEIDRNVGRLRLYKDVLFYQKFSNLNDRYASVQINCCKINDGRSKRIAFNAVGMVSIKEITDTTITYETIFSPYKTETISWSI